MNRRKFIKSLQALAIVPGLGLNPVRSIAAQIDKTETGIVYDDFFLEHWLEQGHPESPARYQAVMDKLRESGLLAQLEHIKIQPELLEAIAFIHSREHIESLKAKHGKSNDVALAVVAGILSATDEVCLGNLKNAFCATRPPGHHARNTGRVEGFCFYNGVAIAARYAQKKHNLKKILIVDWDYHHGDGTELFFYSDPNVLLFQTHDFFAYPGTGNPARTGEGAGKGFNINVHLDCGAKDADIIKAFKEKLLPAAHQFKPELVIISAGFDSRKNDLLGCFDVTDEGYKELTRLVMGIADEYAEGRIVSVLEGGYTLDGLASAANAHVETLNK